MFKQNGLVPYSFITDQIILDKIIGLSDNSISFDFFSDFTYFNNGIDNMKIKIGTNEIINELKEDLLRIDPNMNLNDNIINSFLSNLKIFKQDVIDFGFVLQYKEEYLSYSQLKSIRFIPLLKQAIKRFINKVLEQTNILVKISSYKKINLVFRNV
jgi:hypothetical protein